MGQTLWWLLGGGLALGGGLLALNYLQSRKAAAVTTGSTEDPDAPVPDTTQPPDAPVFTGGDEPARVGDSDMMRCLANRFSTEMDGTSRSIMQRETGDYVGKIKGMQTLKQASSFVLPYFLMNGTQIRDSFLLAVEYCRQTRGRDFPGSG
jgi:hypothetical protein